MPRLFFHLRYEDEVVLDHEGQEVASPEQGLEIARVSLCEIAGDRLKAALCVRLKQVELADDKGNVLGTVRTRDVVDQLLPR